MRKCDAPSRSHGLPKNKGKFQESTEEGADTLIRAAYDLRARPVILKTIPLVEAAAADAARLPRAEPMVCHIHARGETSHLRFTVSGEFADLVRASFDPFGATVLSRDDAEIDFVSVQERTDLLHNILQERLTHHINQKCDDDLKEHWAWHFT